MPVDTVDGEAAERLEAYLRRLRWALSPLPAEERDEIVRETRSHFLERLSEAEDEVERFRVTAEALGDPEEYARAFLDQYRIAVAVAGGSGIGMLRQALRLAGRGVGATLGAFGLLLLFVIAFSLLATAVLKPIFPEHVGLWVDMVPPQRLVSLGVLETAPGGEAREVLGYWIMPLALAVGAGLYRLGVVLLRRFLRSFLRDVRA